MIGGGGKGCQRADHGIGITETNRASFRCTEGHGSGEYDFGDERASARSKTYSLNLWINQSCKFKRPVYWHPAFSVD